MPLLINLVELQGPSQGVGAAGCTCASCTISSPCRFQPSSSQSATFICSSAITATSASASAPQPCGSRCALCDPCFHILFDNVACLKYVNGSSHAAAPAPVQLATNGNAVQQQAQAPAQQQVHQQQQQLRRRDSDEESDWDQCSTSHYDLEADDASECSYDACSTDVYTKCCWHVTNEHEKL